MDRRKDLPGAPRRIAPAPDANIQPDNPFSRFASPLIRLSFSLVLCAVVAAVTGCSTVQTDAAEEEEDWGE